MNLAVLGLGTRGDLYPLLGIGRGILQRDHRVAVLEFDEYAGDVQAAGLSFVPVGAGSQCAQVFESVPVGPATRRREWVTDRLYFQASLDSAAAFVETVRHLDPPPDALLGPAHHIGATLAGELLDVPVVSTFLGMSVPEVFDTRSPGGVKPAAARMLRLIDRLALPSIARMRREAQLGPGSGDQTFARVDRDGGVILSVGPLAARARGMPASFEIAGYPDYYGPDSGVLDEELTRFLTGDGQPVVVCSLGDGWAHALPDQLQQLGGRANEGRYRLLIVSGRGRGVRPGHSTRVVAGVNLRQVLRYADVSVNHGGMGTLVAALRAGVPSVMMSQWPDGRRNAAALDAQGLGIDLGSAPQADDLVRGVDRAIADRGLRQRLAEALVAMDADPDPAEVVLDRLHREGVGDRVGSGSRGGRSS